MGMREHERFAWTDENFATTKRLQAEGYSAAEIAMQIGCHSRSAVIGKLHRAGISGGGKQKHPRGTARKSYGPRRPRVTSPRAPRARDAQHAERSQQAAERRAMFAAEEAVELPPEDLSKAVTLLELTAHTCRWPIGDPAKMDTFRFCGVEPHGEKPYCLRHCRMAYTRPTRPETRAVAA